MAELRDPDLPPGAVVEVDEKTGEGIRNDGKRLKPAEKNPWYVLATIAGEQKVSSLLNRLPIEAQYSQETHATNQRLWNAYVLDELSAAEVAALQKRGVPVEAIGELSEADWSLIEGRFKEAGLDRPELMNGIRFKGVHFERPFVCDGFIFPQVVTFNSSTFAADAYLGSAHFLGNVFSRTAFFAKKATFRRTWFHEEANFYDAQFAGATGFDKAKFLGEAIFRSTNFAGRTSFDGAAFAEEAMFPEARFGGLSDFSNTEFEAQTEFKDTRFLGAAPKFYHCSLRQDTSFTIEESHWPKITPKIAENGKRAYARLRQIMNELQKPDEEHFFFRQEMRCKAFEEAWWNRWPIRAFGWFSDFGYSVARPVAWLLALWIGTAGVFYRWFFSPGCYAGWGLGREGCEAETLAAVGQALALSFANIFPFGLNRLYFRDVLEQLPGGLQVLGGAQTVVGFVLLFFLGLGLRNRFRLK